MTVKFYLSLVYGKKPVFSDVLFYSVLRLYAYIFVHLPSFTIPVQKLSVIVGCTHIHVLVP